VKFTLHSFIQNFLIYIRGSCNYHLCIVDTQIPAWSPDIPPGCQPCRLLSSRPLYIQVAVITFLPVHSLSQLDVTCPTSQRPSYNPSFLTINTQWLSKCCQPLLLCVFLTSVPQACFTFFSSIWSQHHRTVQTGLFL
jgi:hypothetical protein